MNKYQERRFKDYLSEIEYLSRIDDDSKVFYDIKKLRIEFFNWFKKIMK